MSILATWWRERPRLLLLLLAAVVAVVAVAVWLLARGEPDPVDEPVTRSTLDGYPTRGSLAADDDLLEEAEAAAQQWRREDTGGQEEPPSPDHPIEVVWAGDLPAADLAFELEYELEVEDSPTGRLVVLRSAHHVATFLGPVDADGRRVGDLRILADTDDRRPEAAAVLPLDHGLSLLADTVAPGADTEVEVALPFGHDDDGPPDVAVVPAVDGLLVDPGDGAILVGAVSPHGSHDVPGLLFTEGGAVTAEDPDALWGRLVDPRAAPTTWSALRSSYSGTEEFRRSYDPPVVELWDGATLADGTPLAVVAVVTSFWDPAAWWEVHASRAVRAEDDDPRDAVRTDRLGGGRVVGVGGPGPDVPPLTAAWIDAAEDPEEGSRYQLVVAGPDEVASIDVLAAVDPLHVDRPTATWPRPDPSTWVDDGVDPADVAPASVPSVVVVGRTADGTPVRVLTD